MLFVKAEYITQVNYRRTPMNNEVIVTARKITDYEERLMFMPKFFGQYWHFVEKHTYNWMRKLSPENKNAYLSSPLRWR